MPSKWTFDDAIAQAIAFLYLGGDTMRRQHWVTWLMAAVLCLAAHTARAQSGTATLQGKVVDAQKAALPGANVTITNPATGLSRNTQTDTTGVFAFPGMPPGSY